MVLSGYMTHGISWCALNTGHKASHGAVLLSGFILSGSTVAVKLRSGDNAARDEYRATAIRSGV